jgi:hypothetical protein
MRLIRELFQNDNGIVISGDNFVMRGLAIDNKGIILHVDGVAGHADNALNKSLISLFRVDDDYIAATRIGELA